MHWFDKVERRVGQELGHSEFFVESVEVWADWNGEKCSVTVNDFGKASEDEQGEPVRDVMVFDGDPENWVE